MCELLESVTTNVFQLENVNEKQRMHSAEDTVSILVDEDNSVQLEKWNEIKIKLLKSSIFSHMIRKSIEEGLSFLRAKIGLNTNENLKISRFSYKARITCLFISDLEYFSFLSIYSRAFNIVAEIF